MRFLNLNIKKDLLYENKKWGYSSQQKDYN